MKLGAGLHHPLRVGAHSLVPLEFIQTQLGAHSLDPLEFVQTQLLIFTGVPGFVSAMVLPFRKRFFWSRLSRGRQSGVWKILSGN